MAAGRGIHDDHVVRVGVAGRGGPLRELPELAASASRAGPGSPRRVPIKPCRTDDVGEHPQRQVLAQILVERTRAVSIWIVHKCPGATSGSPSPAWRPRTDPASSPRPLTSATIVRARRPRAAAAPARPRPSSARPPPCRAGTRAAARSSGRGAAFSSTCRSAVRRRRAGRTTGRAPLQESVAPANNARVLVELEHWSLP